MVGGVESSGGLGGGMGLVRMSSWDGVGGLVGSSDWMRSGYGGSSWCVGLMGTSCVLMVMKSLGSVEW